MIKTKSKLFLKNENVLNYEDILELLKQISKTIKKYEKHIKNNIKTINDHSESLKTIVVKTWCRYCTQYPLLVSAPKVI